MLHLWDTRLLLSPELQSGLHYSFLRHVVIPDLHGVLQ